MFEGTKLSYIVPGYTGHIPKSYYFDDGQPANTEARHQIPGYIGYIPSIKSENLYGKSYGKLTYDVSAGNHHKGQEIPPDIRYTSASAGIFQDQKFVPLRSAAEIVGVQPKSLQYEKVYCYCKHCVQPLEMEQVNNFFEIETTEEQRESDNNYYFVILFVLPLSEDWQAYSWIYWYYEKSDGCKHFWINVCQFLINSRW